jgi:RimJ/RimL family protein N-acetyltransferase
MSSKASADQFINPPQDIQTNAVQPLVLQCHGVKLEPLGLAHLSGVMEAAADGKLWQLRFTSVPAPESTQTYIENALSGRASGDRFHFAVIEVDTGKVIGCTSYHDILPSARRVDIGWTWYAKRVQRTHVNTACKWLLMSHAFDTLDCLTVGWRTSNVNFASQKAIERLGAKKDGVIRGNVLGRDGSIRDTVMYSVSQQEWRMGIRAHVAWLLRDAGG